MRIIFHENQLSYRGTTNALFDYAYFNEKILHNESIILYNKGSKANFPKAIDRFKKHFKVLSYSDISELDGIVEQEKASLFYVIKSGKNDGVIVTRCKTVVHTVFKHFDPHGDVYAYVSKWLTQKMTKGKYPYVPHMIHVADSDNDLRSKLGIPKDAIVFGRHGGANTFDIPFVKRAIQQIAIERKDIYFLFLGTDEFVIKNFWNPMKNTFVPQDNIVFLPPTSDKKSIAEFINTCDAYLHARKQGESFGIAIGEFSVKNKPVITWGKSKEKSHIDILGEKAIIYKSKSELINILQNFIPNPTKIWDAYSKEFSPDVVMKKFKEVFIDA